MIAFNDGGGRPARQAALPRSIWRKAMRAWAKLYRRQSDPEIRAICLRVALEARQKSLP